MTKSEAIDILRCRKDGDAAEALEVVLKAAEEQPCEDAVSREAVREGMTKYGFRAPDMTVTEFVEDELPPVTPKPTECEDAVSRESLTDTTICEGISCNECSFNKIDGESGCLLRKRVDDLPSVQPICEEREKGECPYYAG